MASSGEAERTGPSASAGARRGNHRRRSSQPRPPAPNEPASLSGAPEYRVVFSRNRAAPSPKLRSKAVLSREGASPNGRRDGSCSSIWPSPLRATDLASRVVPLGMRERRQSKRWARMGTGTVAWAGAVAWERLEAGVDGRVSEALGEHHEPLGRSGRVLQGRVLLTCAHRGLGSRGWPDGLGGWTAARPSHLKACFPLAGVLLGGTRSPRMSSRCTNLYSVMTGLESGPSSRSVPRFRDPSSTAFRQRPREPAPDSSRGVWAE